MVGQAELSAALGQSTEGLFKEGLLDKCPDTSPPFTSPDHGNGGGHVSLLPAVPTSPPCSPATAWYLFLPLLFPMAFGTLFSALLVGTGRSK